MLFSIILIYILFTNDNLQLNARGLLGLITSIWIHKLQIVLWLPFSPLINFRFDKLIPFISFNFHFCMLLLCKDNNFSFDVNLFKFNRIFGEQIEIRTLLPQSLFLKSIKVLHEHSLLFFEQIITLDGKSLIEWKDLNIVLIQNWFLLPLFLYGSIIFNNIYPFWVFYPFYSSL